MVERRGMRQSSAKTMHDVARMAGVSTSTVSHVLNNTRVIRDETRQRVVSAIEEVGYVPNTVARSLVTSSTMSVGVALPLALNPYWTDLVEAIENHLRAAGYMMLLVETHGDADAEREVVEHLVSRRVDGIMLFPVAGSAENSLRWLRKRRTPVILVDRLQSKEFDQVGPNNDRGMRLIIDHLYERGHRRFTLLLSERGLAPTAERLRTYNRHLSKLGIGDADRRVIDTYGTDEGVAAAAAGYLNSPDPTSALILADNRMAHTVMSMLKGRGIAIPSEVAVAICEDFDWADLVSPPLTGVRQPLNDMGGRAVAMLLNRMATADAPPQTVRFAPLLMSRESTNHWL